jgi:hypothetical protein
VATNSSQTLVSVSNLASWVSGTADEIDIADDGDGTITIGLVNPLIVGKGGTGLATLTDHSILLGSGTDAVTPLGVASNGQLPIGSTGADPVLSVLTEGSGISITNGAGSITIAASAGGIDHNSLSGLQGGTSNEYYHLTSSEHVELSGWLDNVTLASNGVTDLDITNTLAAGEQCFYVNSVQGTNALTGTLRGIYSVVTNGEFASSGTIRAIEGKARATLSDLTGGNVGTLEGMSLSADAKNKTVTTLRGAEIILDGQSGASVTTAVGLRISNNFQADLATTSYGLQIYRDSFDYDADIQLSSGGLIGGLTGDLYITSSGNIGIGTISPLSLVHIGDGTVLNSVDTACAVIRNVSTGTGNAHGFSDSSNISRAGGIGYCAFDGRFNISGSENFDHIVSFQAAPTYNSSGTLSNCYGLYVADPTKTDGTITTNYGVYIAEQTAGQRDYSIYAAGASPNYLGGRLGVGAIANTEKLAVYNGTTAGQAMFVHASADGGEVNQKICNDFVDTGSIDETVAIALSFGAAINGCQIVAGKEEDFMSAANRTAWLKLRTRSNGTIIDAVHINGAGSVGVLNVSPLATLDVIGTTRLGDSTTNYAAFASDGELTLVGTARVLKEFELNATSFAPGSSGASEVLLGHYDGWSFGIGDEVVASFEIPHDWDSSTDLTLYLYWYVNEAYATNSGEVQWRIQWSATPPSGTEAIDAPTHTGTIDFGDQNIPATAKFLTKSSGGTIAAASLSAGDLIGLTLDRVALDGGSNPTAEPVMVHMEVHYISNKLGEST